jgi:hypothetical protein
MTTTTFRTQRYASRTSRKPAVVAVAPEPDARDNAAHPEVPLREPLMSGPPMPTCPEASS